MEVTHTPTEIAAMIERLEAWEPLVSSGYEVPAAGRSMLEAAAMLRDVAAERDALANCVAAADKLVPIAEALVARVEALEAERDQQPPSAPTDVKP
jgi:hypothetical protein